MSKSETTGYNLSFAGCGFLGLYHAGVCGCIQEFAPQLYENQKISGVSAGAIAATFLVCNVKLSDCVQYLMQTINSSRNYVLGPFDPRFKITQLLREGLELYLPDDAHILCSGRLHISMTNQTTRENYIAKTYKDKNELIKAVLCSSYIPIFSGFIPLTFRGEWMIDGALTRNMLKLDGKTITVSPFSGDADICPRDDWGCGQISLAGTSLLVNSENIRRIINIIWPKTPEELGKLTQLGYNDALQFLARKGFIKCQLHRNHTVCMKMKVKSQTTIIDENCKKCRKSLHLALQSTVSNTILACFTTPERISYYNYFTKKLGRYLKMLTHISTMPISLSMKIIHRCVKLVKYLPSHLIGSLVSVVRTLTSLDEIFKKAISNAMESNYQHSYLCEALKDFSNNSSNSLQSEIESETINNSESDNSLTDLLESDNFGCNLPDIDFEQKEQLRKQIEDMSEIIEDIYVESIDGHDLDQNRRRPDIPGAEDDSRINISVRGEADGSEESTVQEKQENYLKSGLHLDLEHQMSWSYPDVDNPGQMNYFVLAPVLETNHSSSSENISKHQ